MSQGVEKVQDKIRSRPSYFSPFTTPSTIPGYRTSGLLSADRSAHFRVAVGNITGNQPRVRTIGFEASALRRDPRRGLLNDSLLRVGLPYFLAQSDRKMWRQPRLGSYQGDVTGDTDNGFAVTLKTGRAFGSLGMTDGFPKSCVYPPKWKPVVPRIAGAGPISGAKARALKALPTGENAEAEVRLP